MRPNPAADVRQARTWGVDPRTPGILDSEDVPRLVRIANLLSALVVAGFATLCIFEGPIVAMTGNSLEDDGDACADARMDGFLAKPVEIARLRELLDGVTARPAGGDLPPALVPGGRIGG